MGGLNKLAKMFGAIEVQDQNGNTSKMVWDHVADKAVPEAEMPEGSDRWKASERKKWMAVRDQMDAEKAKLDEGF